MRLDDDGIGAVAKGSGWPTCCCCGTDDMRDDAMQCAACERFGCEADVGEPCPREEHERHAENARKAAKYDEALSLLRNAVARLDELTAERERVGRDYFGATVTSPDFEARRDAYLTASERVRSEAFAVVGTVEAVLGKAGRR